MHFQGLCNLVDGSTVGVTGVGNLPQPLPGFPDLSGRFGGADAQLCTSLFDPSLEKRFVFHALTVPRSDCARQLKVCALCFICAGIAAKLLIMPEIPIADLLREARERLGVGAMTLSKEVGLSDTYILAIERGEKACDPKHAEKLAKALGLRRSDVLRAILVSRDPSYLELLEPPPLGYFLELTPLEKRKVDQFLQGRGFLAEESAPLILKGIVFAYIDGKLQEVHPQQSQE